MLTGAKWIEPASGARDAATVFFRAFSAEHVTKATLYATALGAYDVTLNGERVGDLVLAPGWTCFDKRVQYQQYDVLPHLQRENELSITVCGGWARSKIIWQRDRAVAAIARLVLTHQDGSETVLVTDESWLTRENHVRFADIFDGETWDMTFPGSESVPAAVAPHHGMTLSPQMNEPMRAWVDYIGHHTYESDLWLHTGPWMVFQGKVAPWLGKHVGDWLALDAAPGSYKGASDEGFLASCYYAHSAELVARAGRVIGRDAEDYQRLHDRIIEKIRLRYPERRTQTEHVVALQFGVSEHPQQEADALAAMVRETGHLTTGFLGTPYLLHALSEYGHGDLAWDLLLREEYASWLYTVNKGATTMWEHWDGIREDGTLWKPDMNSYNHYWTGCVADWVFEKAAGIRLDAPGFTQLTISPLPDQRVPSLEAVLDTAQGRIRSAWRHAGGAVQYEIDTPIPANIILDGVCRRVPAGHYIF